MTIGYIHEPNVTNINFKDFDLQITQEKQQRTLGILFAIIFISPKIIVLPILRHFGITQPRQIISNEYQKFSQDIFMGCAIMKTF